MSKEAFDPIANGYDAEFTYTLTGQFQRKRVYEILEKLLAQGELTRVLELSCGTGEDALWLAQHHCQVLATDVSEGMIETARQKINAQQLGQQVECRQLSIEAIGSLHDEEPYDLVFSNFGGFNCLSLAAIEKLSTDMAQLLRPGGHLVLVVMPRFCWWETLYFLAKGKWKEAWRRKNTGPVSAALGNGMRIDTWYHSPKQLCNIFKDNFSIQQARPVGFFLPPSYLDQAFEKRKGLLRFLNRLENYCPESGVMGACSDHFLLHLIRE